MADNLKILSVNVRGLGDSVKRKKIFQWCKMSGNVIFVQETFSTEVIEYSWKGDWEGPMFFFSKGSNHSRGVIVMFKPGITFVAEKTLVDEGGRYVIKKGKCHGEKLILGNVSFPIRNKENAQCDFLSDLNKIICSAFSQEYSLIFGGDFNLIMDYNLSGMGTSNISKSKIIQGLIIVRWLSVKIIEYRYTTDKSAIFGTGLP